MEKNITLYLLLGDPEMHIWQENPWHIVVLTVPHWITLGSRLFSVKVEDDSQEPVAGAVVSVYKEGEILQNRYTDANGEAQVPIHPLTGGTLAVRIWTPLANARECCLEIPVKASACEATISSVSPGRIGTAVKLHLSSGCDGLRAYQVATSLGTGPTPIDTRILRLSLDPIVYLSTAGLAPTIFTDYTGWLDASGEGTATLHVPAENALIGVALHTAFVTLKTGAPSGIGSISNTHSFTAAR